MPMSRCSLTAIVLLLGLASGQVVAQLARVPSRPVGPADRIVAFGGKSDIGAPGDTNSRPASDGEPGAASGSTVPESGTLMLAGSALVGAALIRRRRQLSPRVMPLPADRRRSTFQRR